jgi:uncharacterized protein (TIGR03435 family)
MRNRLGLTLAAGLLLTVVAALGQTAAAAPAASANLNFDVASVKPSAPLDMAKLQADMQAGKMPNFGVHINGLRAEYNYLALKELISLAYKVKAYQVTGPPWIATQRFDIVAKMPEGSTKDDAPKMLQALLEERFKLKAHRDTQEHPVLALVVAKGGPRMKESPATPEAIDPDAPLKPGEMKMEGPDGPIRVTVHPDGSSTANMGAKGTVTQKMDMQTQSLHLDSSMVTMDGFADMLTNVLQMGGGGSRQVVDMTDLKGNYQVALDISIADIMAMARAQGVDLPGAPPGGGTAGTSPSEAADPGGGGSTVYASVQKLGLKLEPRKAPVEQLVVDSVEKTPTED